MTIDLIETKYDSVFRVIVTAGWANESSGDVECPSTGHFAKIDIEPHDADFANMGELAESVFDDVETLKNVHGVEDVPVGYFLAQENDQGQIWVWNFEDQATRDKVYGQFEERYAAWSAATE